MIYVTEEEELVLIEAELRDRDPQSSEPDVDPLQRLMDPSFTAVTWPYDGSNRRLPQFTG